MTGTFRLLALPVTLLLGVAGWAVPWTVLWTVPLRGAAGGSAAGGRQETVPTSDPLSRLLEQRPDDPDLLFLAAGLAREGAAGRLVAVRPEPVCLALRLDEIVAHGPGAGESDEIRELTEKWEKWERDNGFPLLVRAVIDANGGMLPRALDELVEATSRPRVTCYLDEARGRWRETLEKAGIVDRSWQAELLGRQPKSLRFYISAAGRLLLACADEFAFRGDFDRAGRCLDACAELGEKLRAGSRSWQARVDGAHITARSSTRSWTLVHLIGREDEAPSIATRGRRAYRDLAIWQSLQSSSKTSSGVLATVTRLASEAKLETPDLVRSMWLGRMDWANARHRLDQDHNQWRRVLDDAGSEWTGFLDDLSKKGEWALFERAGLAGAGTEIERPATPFDTLEEREDLFFASDPRPDDVVALASLIEPRPGTDWLGEATWSAVQHAALLALLHWIGEDAAGPLLSRLGRLQGGSGHIDIRVAAVLAALGEQGSTVADRLTGDLTKEDPPARYRGLAALGLVKSVEPMARALIAALQHDGSASIEQSVGLFFALRDLISDDFEIDLETWQVLSESLQAPLLEAH